MILFWFYQQSVYFLYFVAILIIIEILCLKIYYFYFLRLLIIFLMRVSALSNLGAIIFNRKRTFYLRKNHFSKMFLISLRFCFIINIIYRLMSFFICSISIINKFRILNLLINQIFIGNQFLNISLFRLP